MDGFHTSFVVSKNRYVFPIEGFMECTSQTVTIEFSEFHFWRLAGLAKAGSFVSLVR